MKKQFHDHVFQLWEFRVSHGQMLVRSPKGPAQQVNIDIMFSGVEYMDLPRYLRSLEIDEPRDTDIAFAAERLGKLVDAKAVTVLKSGKNRHVVVATAVKVAESSMDIFESPFH